MPKFYRWSDTVVDSTGESYSSAITMGNDPYNDGVSEFEDFVEKHNNSNTFATLHICHNDEECDEVYKELFGEEDEEE